MNDNADNNVSNTSDSESLNEVYKRLLSRRGFVKTSLAIGIGGTALQLTACSNDESEVLAKLDNQ